MKFQQTIFQILLLGVIAFFLGGCFSPEPGRDDSNDSFDRLIGVYPQKIQGMVFDQEGALHIQVDYVHAYAPSQPSSDASPFVIRNHETRQWKWKQGIWTQSSLKNLSPYPAEFISAYSLGVNNSLRVDEKGRVSTLVRDEPWIKFYSSENGEWRSRYQWTQHFYSGDYNYCDADATSRLLGPDDRVYYLCSDTELQSYSESTRIGNWFHSLNLWREDRLSTTLRSALLQSGTRIQDVDVIFQGDTLNALVVQDSGQIWIRAIPIPSLKAAASWTIETTPMDSGYTGHRFSRRGNSLVLTGLIHDSVGWWSWKNQQRYAAEDKIGAYENFFDAANCLHSMTGVNQSGPVLDSLDTNSKPMPPTSFQKQINLLYSSSCRDAVDTLEFPFPAPSNPYTASAHIFVLNGEAQPWLANTIDVYNYGYFQLDNRLTLDSLISEWRKGFRFDLLKRGNNGWEKVALPF